MESAAKRLYVLPLEGMAPEDTVLRLQAFDVATARCYDPNEESRLREVIAASL